MGFDVSYHPISEAEMKAWYFDALPNVGAAIALANQAKMEPFYLEKYLNVLGDGNSIAASESFDKTHGFLIAIVQGYFRTFHYTRGSAFSFLVESNPAFAGYTKPWQEILRGLGIALNNPADNLISENYSSGVYIPAEQVSRLLADYHNDPQVRQALEAFYSEGRLAVFLRALNEAQAADLGVLEATEVLEPNPFNLVETGSRSNLFNLDKEGLFLYEQAALGQFAAARASAEQRVAPQPSTGANPADQAPGTQEKKGFFGKLFGKN